MLSASQRLQLRLRRPTSSVALLPPRRPLAPGPQVDPLRGTVAFTAALYGWSFTLESFALLYCEVYQIPLDPKEFARR